MNKRIKELAEQAGWTEGYYESDDGPFIEPAFNTEKFAELIVKDMHRKVVASILITDVVMEEKGQTPTSEDYILAINKDFGVEE